jgi:prepilin-type N-terminal cleavage/methylation domain-containing protein
MSKPFSKSPELRHPQGFTLVELLVTMALSLILLGMAFSLFNQLNDTADVVRTMADVNSNLRVGVNLVARDLATAGAAIPLGGIPLPGGGSGATAVTPINMPGPGARTFNPGTGGYMAIITPGSGFGPTTGTGVPAIPTDVITIITVNPISNLNQYPLTAITYTTTSTTITVDTRTNIASGVSQVVPGQLIMLENSSTCLLTVTAVNTTARTITFTDGDPADVLGLNQFPNPPNGPTTGTIAQLPPVAASTTAYHLNMITYYLDNSNPQKLMRLVGSGYAGTGTAQPVALGINVLQFSYSLSPPATPTDPTRTVVAPNTIRKVNLWMIANADHRARISQKYYSNSIATSVTIQNLAYFNRY